MFFFSHLVLVLLTILTLTVWKRLNKSCLFERVPRRSWKQIPRLLKQVAMFGHNAHQHKHLVPAISTMVEGWWFRLALHPQEFRRLADIEWTINSFVYQSIVESNEVICLIAKAWPKMGHTTGQINKEILFNSLFNWWLKWLNDHQLQIKSMSKCCFDSFHNINMDAACDFYTIILLNIHISSTPR